MSSAPLLTALSERRRFRGSPASFSSRPLVVRPVTLPPGCAEAAAKSLRLQVRPAEARGPEDLEKVFANIAHERPEALVVLASYLFQAHRLRIVELAALHRLPATFSDRSFVEAGGLMSYGPDRKAISRQLASYVDRILKGAKPGDLPIEQPTKFEHLSSTSRPRRR